MMAMMTPESHQLTSPGAMGFQPSHSDNAALYKEQQQLGDPSRGHVFTSVPIKEEVGVVNAEQASFHHTSAKNFPDPLQQSSSSLAVDMESPHQQHVQQLQVLQRPLACDTNKPYKCNQCPKVFANASYLSQHMRIHLGLKPFGPCSYCQRKFTQLSHLQQHLRTHTGDKPYTCKTPGCEKSFSQLSNLQSHSRCHQVDKPFKCNSCYKCFPSEQALLEHIPRHKESKHSKVHICDFCGKSYTQSTYLGKHVAKHRNEQASHAQPRQNRGAAAAQAQLARRGNAAVEAQQPVTSISPGMAFYRQNNEQLQLNGVGGGAPMASTSSISPAGTASGLCFDLDQKLPSWFHHSLNAASAVAAADSSFLFTPGTTRPRFNAGHRTDGQSPSSVGGLQLPSFPSPHHHAHLSAAADLSCAIAADKARLMSGFQSPDWISSLTAAAAAGRMVAAAAANPANRVLEGLGSSYLQAAVTTVAQSSPHSVSTAINYHGFKNPPGLLTLEEIRRYGYLAQQQQQQQQQSSGFVD